jgi:glucose-6-phosphate 1-dehydrogenase
MSTVPGSSEPQAELRTGIHVEDVRGAEEGCPASQIPDPCVLVIFGASGDLVRRKLVPALYYLSRNDLLPESFLIVGTSRTKMSHESFRDSLKESVRTDRPDAFEEDAWWEFRKKIFYHPLDYSDGASYQGLASVLEKRETEFKTGGNRIFYLAVPPTLYKDITQHLGDAGLSKQKKGYTRVIIEKPFGRDLESARGLNDHVHKWFQEDQIFRIDHYLGKETVQNILIFRFMNAIFEPVWNRRYIDHIQITAAETLGVENRAGYYEGAGILRDMFQNHMLQLLALTAMEPPTYFNSDRVREEKIKVFRSLRPIDLNDLDSSLVLGQYGPGEAEGKKLRGYREEAGVSPHSNTPTFAAAKFHVDNWRWQGVPFYIRSGKRMTRKVTEIAIQFKPIPHLMLHAVTDESISPNVLILKIQPDERIMISFQTKRPGFKSCLRQVLMDFSYRADGDGISLDSYERVLLDAMLGDQMLFVREEGVEVTWSILTPVLEMIEKEKRVPPFPNYSAGSAGPREADTLLEREEDRWRPL